ncbi:GDSL esterase/lipase At1g71250-like [Chenopodium quinoa]|uniref:GDSL esterase/lipase At1g71250-like n=1 Tax=Chenopodium quinoa TaxID=63459 RepID=UPI000B786510|nr:GDSL esterase/lipase At1g71250-like [Chenopodium quinoa]
MIDSERLFDIVFHPAMAILGITLFIIAVTQKSHHPPPPPPAPAPAPSFPPSPSVSFPRFLVEDNVRKNIIVNNNGNNNNNNNNTSKSMKSPAIFVMGDSTVDCGVNALFYPLLRRNLSLFPCSKSHQSTLIPHFLAKKMGLPNTPTFYEQNGTIQGILSGINYGSAQATILPFANIPTFQSLNQQQRQAFETIQLLQLQLGEQEAHQFISSSIFYLSLGKDDYINFLFGNSSFSSGYNCDAQMVPRLLVDELTNALRNLYDAGVKKIVTMGVYPLGCAPRTVVNWYFLTGRKRRRVRVCVNEINHLMMQHNRLLNDHIVDLNLQYSDAQFVFCDVYQGFMQILSNPQNFGFGDARGACCGRGWHGAASGCDNMEMACNQTSSHVWWDFYNPSEAVNSLLADSAWSGQPLGDICHPLSIQALANM